MATASFALLQWVHADVCAQEGPADRSGTSRKSEPARALGEPASEAEEAAAASSPGQTQGTPATQRAGGEKQGEGDDGAGEPYRVVMAPTAFTRPAGTGAFDSFQLSFVEVNWGVTDHVQLGVQHVVPAGVFVLGAIGRAGVEFPGGAIAVEANVVDAYLFSEQGNALLFAAGAIVTLGTRKAFFNMGFRAGGVHLGGRIDDDDKALFGIMGAHLGGSVQLGDHLRINGEAWLPSFPGVRDPDWFDFVAVLIGVRVFGGRFWGDIALVEPICDNCGGVYDVVPIGIPFVGFGFSWGVP